MSLAACTNVWLLGKTYIEYWERRTMRTKQTGSFGRAASVAMVLFAFVGCEEKNEAPVKPAASMAAASASVAAARVAASSAAPAEAPPAGCKATGTQPSPLATIVGDIYGFAADATHVYYSTWQEYGRRGELGKIRKDGHGSKGLIVLDLEPRGLAVDANRIFYTSGIRLGSVPKAGGMPTILAPQFSSHVIALDPLYVYGVPGQYGPYDRLAKIDKDGGDTAELATAKRPTGGEGIKGYTSMALDATGIYVADAGGKHVLRFGTSEGRPKVLTTVPKRPFDVAIDDARVYFSVAEGDLMMVSKTGGAATKIASGLVEKSRIAGDGNGIYATLAGKDGDSSAKLSKIVPKEGKATAVATIPDSQIVLGVVADDTCVYWAQRVDAAKTIVYAAPR